MSGNAHPDPSERLRCKLIENDLDRYPTDVTEGYQLVLGATNCNNVTLVDYNGEQISILIPSNPPQGTDLRANTIGATTKCIPITQECISNTPTSMEHPFKCDNLSGMGMLNNDRFEGDLHNEKFKHYIFLEKGHEVVSRYNLSNPYRFGFATAVSGSPSENYAINVDNAFWSIRGIIGFILACNSSVYDVTYRSVNQTATIENIIPSSLHAAQSINGPMMLAQTTVQTSLEMGMLHSVVAANSSADAANRFGQWYSKVSLAFSTATLEEVPSLKEQTRKTSIFTCLPKDALWTLIGLTGSYVVLGIALTVLACVAGNVGSVQSQLTVAGLAAASFENTGLISVR
jgi:hypothetical protein